MNLPHINEKIKALHFDGALCQRAISIDMEPGAAGVSVTAWQCNMASMKTTDLKLPTVLRFELDDGGRVMSAELMDNFKGSQGIPCSQTYLNRVLKDGASGMSFASDDTVFRNELMFHCRHIFELTAAAVSFYRYCGERLDQKNSLFDFTRAFVESDGMAVRDDYRVNDRHIATEEKLLFAPQDIAMQANGKIGRVERLRLAARAVENGEEAFSLTDELGQTVGSGNVVMGMMKLFSGPWKSLGRMLGVRRNYYFTNLVPSSLYGVLIQAIALMIFPNNYNYFQHALAGLQRSEERPLCVGMALDRKELSQFYPQLREEDLFG